MPAPLVITVLLFGTALGSVVFAVKVLKLYMLRHKGRPLVRKRGRVPISPEQKAKLAMRMKEEENWLEEWNKGIDESGEEWGVGPYFEGESYMADYDGYYED